MSKKDKMVKYVYYKHIHDFCNELADLWTEHAPKMRFSQILVGLNKASDRSRQSTYELEEQEMMDVIRHFFKNPFQKAEEDDRRCEILKDRWEDVRELFVCGSQEDEFDLPALIALLKETWQYLIDTADCFGFDNASLPIVGGMYVLLYSGAELKNAKPWETEAYYRFLEGLLQSLERPLGGKHDSFADGYISVEVGIHHFRTIHINDFDSVFAWLSQLYYQNDYIDNYDENGELL